MELIVKKSPSINNFTTYLFKGKKNLNNSEFHQVHNLSFKMWRETWDKTYRQDFHSNDSLASDEFTRQDDILALFYKGECAALCFFAHVDMKDESALFDSYFRPWPKNAIDGLCAEGAEIIICSQFTVAEKFRKVGPKEIENVPWKIILMGMLSKYYMDSGKDGMTGTMRVSKGVEKLTYQFGAIPLIEKLEYAAGADTTLVDLVAFFQANVHNAYYEQQVSTFLDQLWENRNPTRLKIAA